jgi:uncharacterized protein YggT (Ycf19 family)
VILSVRYVILTILNIGLGLIAFFLGLRVVLKLFGANGETPIVSWVYGITERLIYPFSGIFPNLTVGGGLVDIVALISLAAYMLLGYLIGALIDSLIRPPVAHEHSDGTVHSH